MSGVSTVSSFQTVTSVRSRCGTCQSSECRPGPWPVCPHTFVALLTHARHAETVLAPHRAAAPERRHLVQRGQRQNATFEQAVGPAGERFDGAGPRAGGPCGSRHRGRWQHARSISERLGLGAIGKDIAPCRAALDELVRLQHEPGGNSMTERGPVSLRDATDHEPGEDEVDVRIRRLVALARNGVREAVEPIAGEKALRDGGELPFPERVTRITQAAGAHSSQAPNRDTPRPAPLRNPTADRVIQAQAAVIHEFERDGRGHGLADTREPHRRARRHRATRANVGHSGPARPGDLTIDHQRRGRARDARLSCAFSQLLVECVAQSDRRRRAFDLGVRRDGRAVRSRSRAIGRPRAVASARRGAHHKREQQRRACPASRRPEPRAPTVAQCQERAGRWRACSPPENAAP